MVVCMYRHNGYSYAQASAQFCLCYGNENWIFEYVRKNVKVECNGNGLHNGLSNS